MKKVFSLLLPILFCGCLEYKQIQDIYPEHFSFVADKLSHEKLPQDIVNSLPGDFRLANQLGYMTTFIYPDASIGYKKDGDNYKRRKLVSSKLLKAKLSELRNSGYKVYIPIQYPHVICFYPDNIDLIERFENEASIDLFMSLNMIHNNDSTLDELDNEISHLIDSTNDAKKQSEALSVLITNKQAEEQQWIVRNQDIENRIKEMDAQIGREKQALASLGFDKTESGFNTLYDFIDIEKVPTETRNDPFKTTHQKQQVDISNKPYNTPNTSKDGYATLDADMANAMDKFDKSMKDPKSLKDKGFSDAEVAEIESWSKDKSNDIQITSASRSPQHQKAIGNPKKAGTLNSKHLVGVAVDVKLKGKAYDPTKNRKAYDLMRKVAMSAGINFTLPGDAVETMHAVLDGYQDGTAPNKAAYCGKLADLLSGYNDGISSELSNQDGQKAGKDKTKSDINNKLKDLQGEIKNKLDQVNDINKKIGDLQKKYGIFSDAFQKKSNDLCSVLAAKNQKQRDKQKSFEREYNRRDPRPSGSENKERPREAPSREREKTKEFGRSREIRPT